MEAAIQVLEQTRNKTELESNGNDKTTLAQNAQQAGELPLPLLPQLSPSEWKAIGQAWSRLLQTIQEAMATATATATTPSSTNDATETIEWLTHLVNKNLSSGSSASSESSMHMHNEYLIPAIWSASQLSDEASQQAALFDALGEEGLELMFEIASKLPEIAKIPQSSISIFRNDHASKEHQQTEQTTYVDFEEERRQYLINEARNAAHVAELAQAEADLASPGGNNSSNSHMTHTVTRKSDQQLQKAAKKAAKKAQQALQAAIDAGAILDESQLLPANNSAAGAGGLMGRTTSELQDLQQSLLPAGSRQYYEQKGLPKGTEREYGEGYEKVTIPAAQRDEQTLHPRLVIADIMNSHCAKAFAGTHSLNPMQSTVFDIAFHHRDNMLVCAPTGAGKTNVALLTVVAHFCDVGLIPTTTDDDDQGGGRSNVLETGPKVVYIAPMKALAQEVVEKFSEKLTRSLGIIVRELTGDMQLTRAEAAAANVLVTTPEKWDVVTRKSGNDENSLGNQCGLLIIDEVHLLADERGAVIESVVARLHRLVESRQRQVRLVGLSATLPNYRDVAQFLQVPESRGLFYFGGEHRPVPLQQQFIGITSTSKNRFVQEQQMNAVCYEVVVDSLKRGYQVMVFVHSRKGTGQTAAALADAAREDDTLDRYFQTQGKEGYHGDAYNRYVDRATKSRNREVALHFANGIGIHHAGMLRGDRKLTEQMFSDGAIKVLCCTATLAWGINLPAHTVVIKGTEVYNAEKGGMMDLSILDVQQIFGRAGRPQFDKSGEATLITTHDGLPRYLDKLVRAVPIESNFIKQLADHLNAEVVGGTVTTIEEAVTWITYTYLYVRMLKNPLAYGITLDQGHDDPGLRGRVRDLVEQAAKFLDENKMLRYDLGSGNMGVVDMGRVAAHFYIQATSITTFNERLSRDASPTDESLAHLICCASEFENVRIRQEELEEIDTLVEKACALPVAKPIHEPSDKALVLLQAYISRYSIRSFTLISDTNYIASNAGRVARAMFEMCLKRGNIGPAVKLLRIAKSVDRRVWWFQTPLRQFEGNDLKAQVYAAIESKQLGGSGYDTFEYTLSLLDMQPSEVGQLCSWQKGGDKIQRLIRMLPYVDIQYRLQPVTSGVLRFHIELTPVWSWQPRWHGGAESFWLMVEDSDNDRIYHSEYVIFSRRTHPDPMTLDFAVPVFLPTPKQYYIHIMSDSWVGVEQLVPVSFEDLKMPEQKIVHTDLMDLTPLPTSALQDPKYQQLYANKFDTFNPIQTQLFHVLYHTDTPVFVGAPTGSGKTTIAELGLLRMKRLHPKGICVYIAPLKSLARERLKEWKKRFAPLQWNVLELSGDTHHDQRVLSKADVLVCTPEKWDLISRGWKGSDSMSTSSNSSVSNGKAFVKRVRLLVIDEIHLLGEERGAVLEAIISRTRFISQYMLQEEKDSNNRASSESSKEWTRIMGLSTAIANPHDLADWIGIDVKGHGMSAMRGLYNFRDCVRPVPMKVHIQGFPGKHYCPRMATMNKPCYAAIKEHSPTQPTLIFVASRRQTRLTAIDIISYAAADENAKAFLGCSEENIEYIAETIEDEALRHTITFGIGLHHAGLSAHDRDTVERLFLGGEIRVLVATATLAWGVNLPAHFVICKGTEYFDGKTSRYVDYPLTDVLQMIGRAGRPGFDVTGVALVMVQEDKKMFYKKFLYSPFPVESCLNEKMCENLNAEISIGSISSVVDGVGYLTWTFYARRLKANPSYYGANSEEPVEDFLLGVVQDTFAKLEEHKCIKIEKTDEIDKAVQPTILGRCASNYYLAYRTPKQMEFGIMQARKLITSTIEETGDDKTEAVKSSGLRQFTRSNRVDEISVAWLLYSLSSTHEFDELPVRHNEEHLNAELSDDLMWGPDTSVVMNPNQPRGYVNEDVMADPHTKCFLLIQAYLQHAKLPISDYINDTKTVIDQVPRLLAAMHYIAVQDVTIAGNFDLICQFSRLSQILKTRSLVDTSPLSLVPGFNKEVMRRVQRNAKTIPSVWSLRWAPRKETAAVLKGLLKGGKTDNLDLLLNALYSLPSYTVEEMKVTHEVEKKTGKSVGKLKISLSMEASSSYLFNRSNSDNYDDDTGTASLVLVLGTPQRQALLATTDVSLRNGKKDVELSFDWSSANAHGGEGGGSMILRFFVLEHRGLDSELRVPL